MRGILLAMLSLVMLIASSSAQHLRLGYRIPEINVISALGTELDLIEQEYVCLVFMHSESLPCITALEHFRGVAEAEAERMATVLITPEERSDEHDIMSRFVDMATSVAFDNNRRTFTAFGVEYVPYGIIYDSKRRRAVWFGSILRLDNENLGKMLEIHQKVAKQKRSELRKLRRAMNR